VNQNVIKYIDFSYQKYTLEIGRIQQDFKILIISSKTLHTTLKHVFKFQNYEWNFMFFKYPKARDKDNLGSYKQFWTSLM